MRKEKGSGKKGLIILLICLAVAVIAGAGCFVYFMRQEAAVEEYSQKKKTAKKFIDEENYDAAIKTCEQLIALDEKEEEGYRILADVYVRQGDPMAALRTYSDGYRATGKGSLKSAYDDLLQGNMWDLMTPVDKDSEKPVKETETEAEEETAAAEDEIDLQEMAKDTSGIRLLDKFAKYTDSQYVTDFGSHTLHKETDGGILQVRYQKLGAIVCYRNAWTDKMYSEADLLPYSYGKPFVIQMDNIRTIFGTDSEASLSYADVSYILGKSPEISEEAVEGKRVLVFALSGCEIYIECDSEGNLASGSVWNQINLPASEAEVAGESGWRGVVINAVTGEPIENAAIVITDSTGERYETATDWNGVFTLEEAAEGDGMMSISKEGFIPEDMEITLDADEPELGTFTNSPELAEMEMRIVLEWDELPPDLDSYLFGRLQDGTTVQINFTEMTASHNGETVASLDLDDKDGYGPETITLKDVNGTFEYDVHDYLQSGEMSALSGASVKVYLSDGSILNYHIPAGTGNLWRVFSMENGVVQEIGTIE